MDLDKQTDRDMTPKEKAQELANCMWDIIPCEHYPENDNCDCGDVVYFQAVQSAKVAVAEIISQWEYIDTYLADCGGELNPNLKYWKEVKQELDKL